MTVIGPVRPSHEIRLPAAERLDIEQVAEKYLERRRRGEKPSVDEYAGRYPELADEIRDLFPTLAMLEDCASAGGKPAGTAPSEDWLLLSEPIGEYRIIREIGRGGMGVVYEAEHQTLRRRVALKLLPRDAAAHPSSLARFLREARAAGRMHHSNIVSVFEVGVHHDRPFYAMQYIHGQNLDAVIEELRQLRRLERTRRGLDATEPDQVASDPQGELGRTVAGDLLTGVFRQPQEEATAEPTAASSPEFTKDGISDEGYFQRVARVGLQVAEALEYAHRHGILHRDIKPSNLILDTSGTVWVTDFGLAKQEGDDFTHTGDVVGTLRYIRRRVYGEWPPANQRCSSMPCSKPCRCWAPDSSRTTGNWLSHREMLHLGCGMLPAAVPCEFSRPREKPRRGPVCGSIPCGRNFWRRPPPTGSNCGTPERAAV